MAITKTALITQTAKVLGEQTETIRTPIEVFLSAAAKALAHGMPVNLKHFGVIFPDGRFKMAPTLQQAIAEGPSDGKPPCAPDEPVMVSDLREMEARLIAAIQSPLESVS